MVAAVSHYFDLRTVGRRPQRDVNAATNKRYVLPQYLVLAAGISVEPFLNSYIATQSFDMDWSRAGAQLAFGLIMGVIIFPAVYKNSFDPAQPLSVQLCAIFSSGIGWQSLFTTAAEAAT